jgi:hypothetical protein
MATTLNFKDIVDLPKWRPSAPILSASGAGVCLAYDMSNSNADRTKNMYLFRSSSSLDKKDTTTDEWIPLSSPGLAGTFGAGSTCIFAASHGPRSRILSGSTTRLINLDGLGNDVPAAATWARSTTTATVTTTRNHNYQIGQQVFVSISSDVLAIPIGLVSILTVPTGTTFTFTCLNAGAASGTLTIGPAAASNQLANRGDGVGYTIRIIDNGAGGSGRVEERKIISNTFGAAPTVELTPALNFTPVAGSTFEIRSGRVFMINSGAPTAGMFKYYDSATNTYSGNLATANLPTIGTDSSLLHLCEDYVQSDRSPSIGFVSGGATYDGGKNCIAATAATSTTITGSGMSSTLLADEYRNFQIRIVEDTVNTTAVGQRRRITSHTSGAAGVFTVPAFAVTPSSSAKFVVENEDDKILLFTNQTAVYTYNASTNAWDTTTFAASPAAGGAGIISTQSFGITLDTQKAVRHSMIYRIRGGNSAIIDVLDISAGSTGVWTADIWYGNKGQAFTTGTSGAYDPITFGGRFLHICVNATQRFARLDLRNRILDPGTYLPFAPSTAVAGGKCAMSFMIDGSTKLGFLINLSSSSVYSFDIAIQR